jgi:hypothetical protein
MEKPGIFTGSSTEGLKIAEAVFAHLSHESRPKLWTHNLFLPGDYPMEALEKQVRQHAFAILVASPDDQLIKRGATSPAMRDNLLLEFGLFAGALGRKRAFFLCPNTPKVELPSDLFGIIVATYDGSRVDGGTDEIAAAAQVACQQIRDVIREQWGLLLREREMATSRIRASEKGKAVERLHNLVIQLRDALVVVQRDAFAAVSDEGAFTKVKAAAGIKVQEIAKSFQEDARIIGVDNEVQQLSDETSDALHDLPFPHEISLGKETSRQKTINTGIGALNAFLGGGDPFQHVQDVVSQDVSMRVETLKRRYMEWWDQHYPLLQGATAQLQDKLFSAAMDLASRASTEATF